MEDLNQQSVNTCSAASANPGIGVQGLHPTLQAPNNATLHPRKVSSQLSGCDEQIIHTPDELRQRLRVGQYITVCMLLIHHHADLRCGVRRGVSGNVANGEFARHERIIFRQHDQRAFRKLIWPQLQRLPVEYPAERVRDDEIARRERLECVLDIRVRPTLLDEQLVHEVAHQLWV